MARQKSYRVPPSEIAVDRKLLRALRQLLEYKPLDPAYAVDTLGTLDADIERIELALHQNRLAQDVLRAELIRATWAFHEGILGAKAAVYAQFGPESDAIHALGMKRKSERKPPRLRKVAVASS